MTKTSYPEIGSKITSDILPWCLSFDQVAEILHVSRRTVEGYVSEGRFPTVDLGYRTKRVYYKDLEIYVNNRREIDEAMSKYYKELLNQENTIDRFTI